MKSVRIVIASLVGAICLSINTAGAASHCKGLSESVCSTDTSCRWVAAYTRKDGREVSSHCRLGKKAQQSLIPDADGKKVSAVD